jgi:hypothetical protein
MVEEVCYGSLLGGGEEGYELRNSTVRNASDFSASDAAPPAENSFRLVGPRIRNSQASTPPHPSR